MRRARNPFRTSVSFGMAFTMLALSVAVPAMERDGFSGGPVAESEHDPGSCPVGHDHTVCTQVSANGAAPARIGQHRVARAQLRMVAPATPVAPSPSHFADGHPSRAPPIA